MHASQPTCLGFGLSPLLVAAFFSLCVIQCFAAEHVSVVEIDHEKSYLISTEGTEIRVDIYEFQYYCKVVVREDGQIESYDIPHDHRTFKIDIGDLAKSASFNYQLGDEYANALQKNRRLIYDGCDGTDTVSVNLEYDRGGDLILIDSAFELEVTTGASRDHVSLTSNRFARPSSLRCIVDLGDDSDYFRFYTRKGSESEAGLLIDAIAGGGNDSLWLEYYGQSSFQNGPVLVNYRGGSGNDELKWHAGGTMDSLQFIQFQGGFGQDLILGRILQECPNSSLIEAHFSGESSRDGLGFQIDGNPNWQGKIALDGGPNLDYYYPSEKNDERIILMNVEIYLYFLMSLF